MPRTHSWDDVCRSHDGRFAPRERCAYSPPKPDLSEKCDCVSPLKNTGGSNGAEVAAVAALAISKLGPVGWTILGVAGVLGGGYLIYKDCKRLNKANANMKRNLQASFRIC